MAKNPLSLRRFACICGVSPEFDEKLCLSIGPNDAGSKFFDYAFRRRLVTLIRHSELP